VPNALFPSPATFNQIGFFAGCHVKKTLDSGCNPCRPSSGSGPPGPTLGPLSSTGNAFPGCVASNRAPVRTPAGAFGVLVDHTIRADPAGGELKQQTAAHRSSGPDAICPRRLAEPARPGSNVICRGT